jgi:hypothetical protein
MGSALVPGRRRPRRPPTQSDVRRLALSLPETHEHAHFGRPDLRVRNKIFATLPPDGRTVNLKSTRPNLAALVATDPETFRDVWGGMWVGVDLARVDAEVLRVLVVDAWRLAAPKSLAAKLAD